MAESAQLGNQSSFFSAQNVSDDLVADHGHARMPDALLCARHTLCASTKTPTYYTYNFP